MKKLLFILMILIFSQGFESFNNFKSEEPTILKIEELVERYVELGRFSGSVLISVNDSILFDRYFGYADYSEKELFTERSSFKIGSLSQLFIQKILRDLIIEKQIDLNDNVSEYIKDYQDSLKLKTLLENHSILKNEESYLLLKLFEELTELSLEESILDLSSELGLKNTYYKNESPNRLESKGHLYMNQGFGLKWIQSPIYNIDSVSILQGLKSNSRDILLLVESLPFDLDVDDYLENDGFSYSVDKEDGVVVILLSNTRHPVGKEMTKSIQSIISNSSYELPLERKEISLLSKTLKDYSGKYSLGPDMILELLYSNDSLFAMMGPTKIYLKAQSKNQFFMDESDASIKFIKDSLGRVEGAIMLDGFLTGPKALKIDE